MKKKKKFNIKNKISELNVTTIISITVDPFKKLENPPLLQPNSYLQVLAVDFSNETHKQQYRINDELKKARYTFVKKPVIKNIQFVLFFKKEKKEINTDVSTNIWGKKKEVISRKIVSSDIVEGKTDVCQIKTNEENVDDLILLHMNDGSNIEFKYEVTIQSELEDILMKQTPESFYSKTFCTRNDDKCNITMKNLQELVDFHQDEAIHFCNRFTNYIKVINITSSFCTGDIKKDNIKGGYLVYTTVFYKIKK